MINGLGETDSFHELHSHLIDRFWTFFYGEYIRTNINKTRIKDLNDLKTRITQEIQSIEKRSLCVVFLEMGKRLSSCISLKDNTFEQYL